MSKSIIQNNKECYICESTNTLHEHHIFFGKNRKLAEKYGLKVYLCWEHHEGTYGVHGREGHALDLKLKKIAQTLFMKVYSATKEEFISKFGKSYI